MWPIEGETDEEMTAALKKFLEDSLEIEDTQALRIEWISRARNPDGGIVYNELIIRFSSPEDRDYVASRGPQLSGMIDDNGDPMAGVRTHVPEHLKQTFRLLDSHGYALKRRYGEHLKNTSNLMMTRCHSTFRFGCQMSING